MELYARVNILDGKAVRLPRGALDQVIYLDADPLTSIPRVRDVLFGGVSPRNGADRRG